MPIKPSIVCIVGSTRFKQFHLGHAQRFTLMGKIVLVAGFWHHVDARPITDEEKKNLDELLMHKIKLCDEVFVVNKGGYIGQTTAAAITLARDLGKKVAYDEDPTETPTTAA
jgi:hypothetical protein